MKLKYLIIIPFTFLIVQLFGQEGFDFQNEEGEVKEVSITLPGFNESQDVEIVEINGKVVFHGCVVVESLDELKSQESAGRGGTSTTASYTLWADAKLPYVLADNHPRKDEILWAIEHINSQTDFDISPRTCERDYIEFTYDGSDGGGFYTNGIGRPSSGKRKVNIRNSTTTRFSRGSIVHELCHAIGMFHEHTRTDRNTFVNVNVSGLSRQKAAQYKIFTQRRTYGSTGGVNRGSYDYGSIMHYPETAGVMTAKQNTTERIGQRSALSSIDISTLNTIARVSKSRAPSNPKPCESESTENSSGGIVDAFQSVWGYVFGENEADNGGATVAQSFNIQYDVELVPQQTDMSCWAAGAAMLVGWFDKVCINPEEIASQIGYWAQYDSQGLNASDLTMLNHWYLKAEPPQSYTVEGFVQMLGTHGPLWVATHEGGPHVRVVAGASGDGTPEGTILKIYDPWQRGMRRFRSSNTGSVYQETFAEWVRKNHELAGKEMDEPAPIYVAHN